MFRLSGVRFAFRQAILKNRRCLTAVSALMEPAAIPLARIPSHTGFMARSAHKVFSISASIRHNQAYLPRQYLSEFVGVSQYLAKGDVIKLVQVRTFDISRGLSCFARFFRNA